MTPLAKKTVAAVSARTGVAAGAIINSRRVSKFAREARNEVWAKLYQAGYSHQKIGIMFNRDVSTVWHGVKTHNQPKRGNQSNGEHQ